MKPGQLVKNTESIKIGGIVNIPTNTLGIVQFSDRGVATVQFEGHILQHNIPLTWLVAMKLKPDGKGFAISEKGSSNGQTKA